MARAQSISLFGLAMAIGSSLACSDTTRVRMVPASGRVPRTSAAEAADSVARMRCDLEERCDRIGALESFPTFTKCMEHMHLEVAEGMNEQCIEGVTRERLRYCMGEVAASDCTPVSGTSFPACNAATLCR